MQGSRSEDNQANNNRLDLKCPYLKNFFFLELKMHITMRKCAKKKIALNTMLLKRININININFVIRSTSVPKKFSLNSFQKKSHFLEYTNLLRRNYSSNTFFQSTKSTNPQNRDNKKQHQVEKKKLSMKQLQKIHVIKCT